MFGVLARTSSLLILLATVFPALAEPGLPPLTHGLTAIAPGSAAPALTLPDLDEEQTDINDLRGSVVVVNFWATWCPPCRREMPSLERLRQEVADEDVIVLAVNIGEDADTVFSFLGTVEPSPTFPMLLDQEGGSLEAWGVLGLPTTFIVAPDGSLAYRAVGGREFDHPALIAQLRRLHTERPGR